MVTQGHRRERKKLSLNESSLVVGLDFSNYWEFLTRRVLVQKNFDWWDTLAAFCTLLHLP